MLMHSTRHVSPTSDQEKSKISTQSDYDSYMSDLHFEALYVSERPKRFRCILFTAFGTSLIVVLGSLLSSHVEIGISAGALFVALVTLWAMLED
jgi:hypothetical protein